MKKRLAAICLGILLATYAAAEERITLERPGLYDLQYAGFEVARESEVRIDAVGIWDSSRRSWIERLWRGPDTDPMSVFAWLLDGNTRKPVWTMEVDDTDRESKYLRRAERSLLLGPGRYELYLFAGYHWAAERVRREDNRDAVDEEEWWRRMFSDNRSIADLREDLERCYVTVSGDDLRTIDVTGELAEGLIRLGGVGDSRLVSGGFALSRPTALRVYTLFEQGDDAREAADYGWIVDAETREVVWEPSESRSRRAGGGNKNRMIDQQIELPSGRYVVYFGSDDSHSVEGFNVPAPYDPLNWGITLLPGEGFDQAAFSTFEPVEPPTPLVEFAEVGSDEFHQRAFRLDRETRLQVYALGEYDYDDGQFYDCGWIIDAGTGETVWEMTGRNTRGAGGAEKNRLFDGLVTLPAGRYVAHYVTDGSHSFGDWNSAKPIDPASWGIRIAAGPGSDPAWVTVLDDDDLDRSEGYLVRIAYVGDDERIRREFTLDQPSTVEIRAVGEGQSGNMYDYGYVRRRDDGRVVWEMDYDDTSHAGGADKNRMVLRELRLEAGEYEAIYVTDDSHSFGGWNAERPRDPTGWGLTIRQIDR